MERMFYLSPFGFLGRIVDLPQFKHLYFARSPTEPFFISRVLRHLGHAQRSGLPHPQVAFGRPTFAIIPYLLFRIYPKHIGSE